MFPHRNSFMWTTCLAAMLALSGCASTNERNQSMYEDPGAGFELGANRPPTPQTLRQMAKLLALQQRDEPAEYVLRRLIQQHRKYVPAYCDLAELQMRQERIDEAVVTLQAGLDHAPADAVLLNNLGMVRLVQGEDERALEHFTAASVAEPADARYRANVAMVLGKLTRYDESLAIYQQIIPQHEAHYNVAVLSRANADHERADAEFKLSRQWERLAQHRWQDTNADAAVMPGPTATAED